MIKKINDKIEFYQSEKLNQHSAIKHFFSTRKGDLSEVQLLSKKIGFNSQNIIIPKQSHSCNITIVTTQNKDEIFENTDAFITNEPGICITVKTADCTPVLLFDTKNKIIAAIHSGWRGTVQNITGKTIQKMVNQFNSDVKNMIAAIGPCIGQPNYEVGPEVVEQFCEIFSNTKLILDKRGSKNGKAKLNVRQAIFQQLLSEGLPTNNIDISELCTYNRFSDFYSARRDGADTGRMINGIFLK